MIKKWIQFIKEDLDVESSVYWSDKEDMIDIFRPLSDEEYLISMNRSVFNYSTPIYTYVDPETNHITSGSTYFPGWSIEIKKQKNRENANDLTIDLRGIISRLKSEGYGYYMMDEDDELVSEKNIYLKESDIILFIPEDGKKTLDQASADLYSDNNSDIYTPLDSITLYFYQDEEFKITESDLAEIYQWRNYKIYPNGKIYCVVDIEDMSSYLLNSNSNSHYESYLVNGIDIDNYYNNEYRPDIHSLFAYSLDKENEKLAIRCLIKESGGLSAFVDMLDSELEGKSEEEVVNICLSKTKSYHRSEMQSICDGSEIIDEVRQICGGYECQAHCDENEKEILDEFDDLVKSEGIEANRVRIEGRKFYYKREKGTKNKEKIYFDDEVWAYEVTYDNKWITEVYPTNFSGWNLQDLLHEWISECNFNNDFSPHFSDYGDVDKEQMNKDIKFTLESFLK